jgi:DNA-binding response OmpR family regulator
MPRRALFGAILKDKKLILVIDDDAELRDGLKRALDGAGFAAVRCDSGEAARDMLARIKPDAIIIDRMMAGIDGLSLLSELRAAGDVTPAMVLTAMAGGDNAADGLAGGADDYLAKPFSLRELILRMENILKKSGADSKPAALPGHLRMENGEFFADGARLPLNEAERIAMTDMLAGRAAAMPPMAAKRLKAKLAPAGLIIANVRGKGYKITRL